MIRRILVALDGSDHAERALTLALVLAQQYSAETQLLTVVSPLFLPMHSMTVATSELIAEVTTQLENIFMGVLYIGRRKSQARETQSLRCLQKLNMEDLKKRSLK